MKSFFYDFCREEWKKEADAFINYELKLKRSAGMY
jgi:hypothetical protein